MENVNMYLKVTAPVVTLSFKNDNQIILLLENLTQNHILINPAEDVKIYIKSTSGWERVNNNINYINTNANVPVQSSDLPVGKTLGIFPDLQGNVPVTLRVIVIGRPENMLGVTNIISYVDITVNP